jgi:dipeptidyl aminopeptidase/acylaminoacyl peptidase
LVEVAAASTQMTMRPIFPGSISLELGLRIEPRPDPATRAKTPLWTDGRNADFPDFPVAPDLVAAPYDYAFSPDGSRAAFTGYVDRGSANCCKVELFVMNVDGSGLTQLTHDDAYDSFPSWSPDGTELVFSSYRGTHYVGWTRSAGRSRVRSAPGEGR